MRLYVLVDHTTNSILHDRRFISLSSSHITFSSFILYNLITSLNILIKFLRSTKSILQAIVIFFISTLAIFSILAGSSGLGVHTCWSMCRMILCVINPHFRCPESAFFVVFRILIFCMNNSAVLLNVISEFLNSHFLNRYRISSSFNIYRSPFKYSEDIEEVSCRLVHIAVGFNFHFLVLGISSSLHIVLYLLYCCSVV